MTVIERALKVIKVEKVKDEYGNVIKLLLTLDAPNKENLASSKDVIIKSYKIEQRS